MEDFVDDLVAVIKEEEAWGSDLPTVTVKTMVAARFMLEVTVPLTS